MLAEMGTAGVGMAVLVTLIWGVMVFASDRVLKRGNDANAQGKETT